MSMNLHDADVTKTMVCLLLYSIASIFINHWASETKEREVTSIKKLLDGRDVIIVDLKEQAAGFSMEKAKLIKEIDRLRIETFAAQHGLRCSEREAELEKAKAANSFKAKRWPAATGLMFANDPKWAATPEATTKAPAAASFDEKLAEDLRKKNDELTIELEALRQKQEKQEKQTEEAQEARKAAREDRAKRMEKVRETLNTLRRNHENQVKELQEALKASKLENKGLQERIGSAAPDPQLQIMADHYARLFHEAEDATAKVKRENASYASMIAIKDQEIAVLNSRIAGADNGVAAYVQVITSRDAEISSLNLRAAQQERNLTSAKEVIRDKILDFEALTCLVNIKNEEISRLGAAVESKGELLAEYEAAAASKNLVNSFPPAPATTATTTIDAGPFAEKISFLRDRLEAKTATIRLLVSKIRRQSNRATRVANDELEGIRMDRSTLWAENVQLTGELEKMRRRAKKERDLRIRAENEKFEVESKYDHLCDEKAEYEYQLGFQEADAEDKLANELEAKDLEWQAKLERVRDEARRRTAAFATLEKELRDARDSSRRQLNQETMDLRMNLESTIRTLKQEHADEIAKMMRAHTMALRRQEAQPNTGTMQVEDASSREAEYVARLERQVNALKESFNSLQPYRREAHEAQEMAKMLEDKNGMLNRRIARLNEDLAIEKGRRDKAERDLGHGSDDMQL